MQLCGVLVAWLSGKISSTTIWSKSRVQGKDCKLETCWIQRYHHELVKFYDFRTTVEHTVRQKVSSCLCFNLHQWLRYSDFSLVTRLEFLTVCAKHWLVLQQLTCCWTKVQNPFLRHKEKTDKYFIWRSEKVLWKVWHTVIDTCYSRDNTSNSFES